MGDLKCGECELEATLDVIIDATLLDVRDSEFNFLGHKISALVAFLDLIKVVVSSHSIDEPSNEVWDCHGSNVNVSEHLLVWSALVNSFLVNNNNLRSTLI